VDRNETDRPVVRRDVWDVEPIGPLSGKTFASRVGMIEGMCEPGNDVELVAKTTGEVVKALAGESGALGPVRAYAEYISGIVHYRHYPKLVARAMAAAEKIERSGLPRRAFSEISDPPLRAILVSAAEEDEPTMQQRWENLLANAVTIGPADVKRAFTTVLSDVEPAEAAQLDRYANETSPEAFRVTRFPISAAEVGAAGLDNLVRLGLLDYAGTFGTPPGPSRVSYDRSNFREVMFTEFGSNFVHACRAPISM
jgi:hypothetical protein